MKGNNIAAVVIADDHYNGLGIIRSLGEVGVAVNLVLLKNVGNTIIDKSKYVVRTLKIERTEEDIIAAVRSLINESEKFVIVPLCDFAAEVIDDHLMEFPNNISVPNANGNLHNLMNKYKLSEIVRSYGICVPNHKEITFEETESWSHYPAIIKPLASVEGQKTDIVTVNNKDELEAAFIELKEKGYRRALVEDFIDGINSFMVEVLGYVDKEGEPHFSQVIHKLREYPIKNGSTAYAFFEENAPYIDREALKKVVKATQYWGIFDIEFKYADGKAYFIEMNFRNGAPAYAATKCGFNIVGEWTFDSFGISEKFSDQKYLGKLKRIYFMCEHRDVINMLKRYVSFPKWVKSFFRSNKLIWSWKDIRPSWIMYAGVVKTMFRRLFNE